MGNEASRADSAGLSPPQALASGAGRAASVSRLPTTPLATPTGQRRAQSFSSAPATPRGRATSAVGTSASNASNASVERTIQRMDRAIRKRVRGGVTYNMRIVVRGARGTGKTSLFQRLKGEPIPETHTPTPQLQSATINWSFRAGSEESVKCEVWDVVDRGVDPAAGVDATAAASGDPDRDHDASSSPFELGSLHGPSSHFASVRASAAVAASIASASGAAGAHAVAAVDATTVDVYHETHGVVFLLDVTKWDTLEYVRQQLELVPAHIPTLVLGNFRDCGNQRKVFKEDVQDLLYGRAQAQSSRTQQPLRRPRELLYFECSLLNCYGLKALHQYFGVPFLQLKLATLRQQVRIVEGDFAHLKHDLQAKISEQRYADYVEHIRTTGSDIRTGRKASSGTLAPGLRHAESTIVVSGDDDNGGDRGSAQPRQVARTLSSASTGSDIVVPVDEAQIGATPEALEAVEAPSGLPVEAVASETTRMPATEPDAVQKDAEDLPERTNSLANQVTAPLKFEHSASSSSLREELATPPSPLASTAAVGQRGTSTGRAGKPQASTKRKGVAAAAAGPESSVFATATVDEPMSLEDFQVPKPKNTDLDSFYSDDDDSGASGESDGDVIIQPSAALLAKKHGHKQQFLYSDSSGSDDGKRASRTARRTKSPRQERRVVTETTKSAAPIAATAVVASAHPLTSPASKTEEQHSVAMKTFATVATVENNGLSPQPPALSMGHSPAAPHPPQPVASAPEPPGGPTTSSRPTSPGSRSSRSPSPRQKLDSSRSHNPRTLLATVAAAVGSHSSSGHGNTAAEELDQVEREPDSNETADAAKMRAEVGATADPDATAVGQQESESPVEHGSPHHRLQSSTATASSPRTVDAMRASDGARTVTDDLPEEKVVRHVAESESEATATSVHSAPKEMAASGAYVNTDEDELVVLSNEIETFFSDDGEDEDTSASSSTVALETATRTVPSSATSSVPTKPTTRAEMLTSDDDGGDSAAETWRESTARGTPAAACETSTSVQASSAHHVFKNESDVVPERRHSIVGGFVSDDDGNVAGDSSSALLSVSSRVAATASTGTSRLLSKNKQRPDMLMSDNEAHDLSSEQATTAPVGRPQSANWHHRNIVMPPAHSSSSPTSRPTRESPRNELDGFFSDSDSASEGGSQGLLPPPPASRKAAPRGPRRPMVARSDDDDDDSDGNGTGNAVDRFANYDAKAVRKSKAERRQERDEIRRMTASLTSSRLFDEVPTVAAATVAGTASADVLAAIRAAEEEAMRMLPPSSDGDGVEREKKHRHKSSKTKSSRSSKHHHHEGDDADASATNQRRSSSSKSASSSARSSRRRDDRAGDADSKAKW